MTTTPKPDEISRQLDLIIRILSYQLIAGKTLTHGAPILKRLGLTAAEIAAVFATTPNTVNVRLAESRKAKKPKSDQ